MKYHASGLAIESDRELFGLSTWPLSARCDVSVIQREVNEPIEWIDAGEDRESRPWLSVGVTAEAYVLEFAQGTFALSRTGDQIAYGPGLPSAMFTHLLLDHALPRLLSLRGGVALHATAIRYAGRVAAFLGATGAGKSTLAAALCARGAAVFADDCLRVEVAAGPALAYPGYLRLRVFPDVRDRFFQSARSTECFGDKVWVDPASSEDVPAGPAVLSRVYVLERAEAWTRPAPLLIRSIAAARALIELSRHTFRIDPRDTSSLTRELGVLAHVASRASVRELAYRSSLDALDAVADAVLSDLLGSRDGE